MLSAPEISGRQARMGFDFQDLCAVRFCLEMLVDSVWTEVCCESHEDIVLIKEDGGTLQRRYVQVKFRVDADNHWSISQISRFEKSEKKTIRDSIIVKLFESGAYADSNEYRLAINEGVGKDLRAFHYRWGTTEAKVLPGSAPVIDLESKLKSWQPEGSRAKSDYIIRFAVEQHCSDITEMEAVLIQAIDHAMNQHAINLYIDQLKSVLVSAYSVIHKAASSRPGTKGNPEKISREKFSNVLLASAKVLIRGAENSSQTTGGEIVREVLEKAGIPNNLIANAIQSRQDFVTFERLNRGSSMGTAATELLSEVHGIYLGELIAELSIPSSDAIGFLTKIFDELKRISADSHWRGKGINFGLAQGALFTLVQRGLVQFEIDL